MRDPRFDRGRRTTAEQEQAIDKGRACESQGWFDSAVEIVSRWYLDSVAPITLADGESPIFVSDDSLRAALSAIDGMPEGLTERIEQWVGTHYAHEEDAEAGWIWGAALAKAGLTYLNRPPVFSGAWRKATQLPISAVAFRIHLATTLLSGNGAALMTYLADIATSLSTLEGCWIPGYRNRDDVVQEFISWWDTATIFSVWEDRSLHQRPVHCDDAWLIGVVLLADQRRFLELLEETRNLPVIQKALEAPDIVEDFDKILKLLAVAPTACGPLPLGALALEWNKQLTAPILLGIIYAHVDRLAHILAKQDQPGGEQDELARFLTQEIPAYWARAIETVLARTDGPFLVIHWLVHLCRDIGRIRMADHTDIRIIMLQAVAQQLASHGVDKQAIQSYFPAIFDVALAEYDRFLHDGLPYPDPDPNGLVVLIALASLSIQSDASAPSMADPLLLLRVLSAILAQRHPALSQHFDAPPESWRLSKADSTIVSWRHAYAARIFVLQADPRTAWQEIWSSLSEQRRRLFHQEYTQDHTADDPSVFVVYTGIAVLESFQRTETDSMDGWLALWEVLFSAALSLLSRVTPGTRLSRWSRVVSLLIASLSTHLDGAAAGSNDARVSAALKRLGGDDGVILEAVVELAQFGMPVERIETAVAAIGTPLDTIIQRYDTFIGSPGPGPHVLPAQHIIQQCKVLWRQAAI